MSNLATIVNNILADSGIDDINVVVTTGSYANPAWITSLAWSKITGTPTTLSGYGITDAVTLGTNQTITGVKTFSQDIIVNGLNIGKGTGNNSFNTAVGVNSLLNNSAINGTDNTAVGHSALSNNTEGYQNTAIGSQSLLFNTLGVENTAVGFFALNKNTSGNNNTAIGVYSLYKNLTGYENTSVGYSSLSNNTIGINNDSFGVGTLFNNATGSKNSAFGTSSIYGNTTGSQNTAIGFEAGTRISAGTYNTITNNSVYIGYDTRANANNETNQIVIGYNAIGNGSNTVTIGNSSITNNYFTGNIRGGAFIKSGGTSSQYLMADGSVNTLTNPITGTGTTNYLPKFTGSTTLGNSLIYDNGTNVLIGTTTTPTPVAGVAFPLSVTSAAATRIRIDSTQATPNSGFGLYANSVQKWSVAMFGTDSDFTIYNDALLASAVLIKGITSNVLIGYGVATADTGFKLDVNGTGRFSGALTGTTATFGSTGTGNNVIAISNNDQSNVRLRITNTGSGGRTYSLVGGLNAANNSSFSIFDETAGSTRFEINSTGAATFSSSVTANARSFVQGAAGYLFDVQTTDANQPRLQVYVDDTNGVDLISGYNSTAKSLRFVTGNSPRMTITSGGNVLIGSDSSNGVLELNTTLPASSFSQTTAQFYIKGNVRYDMGPTINYYPSVWRNQLENIFPFGGTSDLVWAMSANGGAYTTYMQLGQNGLYSPNGINASDFVYINSSGIGIGGYPNNGSIDITEYSTGRPAIWATVGGNTSSYILMNLREGTGGNSRFYVRGDGNIGIGTTSPAYRLQLSTDSAAKPSTNTWTIASDVRLKENINPYLKGLETLMNINPVTYDYNGKGGFKNLKNNIGIIAQDVLDILPESISTYKNKLNEDDLEEIELFNFNSHALTYILINSVKELKKELDTLKNKQS